MGSALTNKHEEVVHPLYALESHVGEGVCLLTYHPQHFINRWWAFNGLEWPDTCSRQNAR